MSHKYIVEDKYCSYLLSIDEEMASIIKHLRCPHCGGRLDRADYPRKPRGGMIAQAGEAFDRRISFCCCKEGCRKRVTPPSVRFFGRKVYLGASIIVASLRGLMVESTLASLFGETGIAARTIRRWLSWWRNDFVRSQFFAEACGRFMPPLEKERLPASILERFAPAAFGDKLLAMLKWLAPTTTTSGNLHNSDLAFCWSSKDTQKMALGICLAEA